MKDPAQWITKNQVLLTKYKGKYVAISDGIIASGDHLSEVNEKAKAQNKEYVLYYVPYYVNKVRVLPIHVKTISVHEWHPLYLIELLSYENEIIKQEGLIDSGADISCFPYKLGLDLGLERYPQEIPLKAFGFGGEIDYLQRQGKIIIDGHEINIPFAWIQDKDEVELIIGRAVVFDYFDITFKQAEEKIEFYWRGQKNELLSCS